jgi:hypothetical protein
VPESGELLLGFKAAIADSILDVLPSSTSNEVTVTSVDGVLVRRSLRVLQETPPPIEVGFRVVVTRDCFQQDCANQDATNAILVEAYSEAIINSVDTGDLIVAIQEKAITIQGLTSFANASVLLQSGGLALISVGILKLPSASPSSEPSSLPSLEPSAFPSKDKKDKKEKKDKKDKKEKKDKKDKKEKKNQQEKKDKKP